MHPVADEPSLRAEMEQLFLRHRHLLAEAHSVPCTWVLEERGLCWHVVLDDALEPDIDIEQLHDALIIRARVGNEVREALILVPGRFRESTPRCAFRSQLLEIRFVV